jgi:hypothetical protein
MLLGNKANPGRQVAAGREGFPIAYFRHQSCGDDRANAGDLLEPPAFGARAVPGMDALLNDPDLCRDRYILPSKNIETEPRGGGNAIVILSSNDLEQLGRAIASPCRDNAAAICPRIALDSIVR